MANFLPTNMSGPEHYRESERLLNQLTENKVTLEQRPVLIAVAQVHATLALAAATAASEPAWGSVLEEVEH